MSEATASGERGAARPAGDGLDQVRPAGTGTDGTPGAAPAVVTPAAGSQPPAQPSARTMRGALGVIARHRGFAIALAVAAGLRAVVMLGFRPVLWFSDSNSYVYHAVQRSVSTVRPAGYSVLLYILMPLHSFAVVALVQHLLGLGTGLVIYALLRHRGLPGWAATLAAAPVLFDAYQLQLEQLVMSDPLFMILVLAAVALLCWPDRVSVPSAAVAGLLIGAATIVRSVGLPLIILAAASLAVRRAGWRPVAALVGVGVVPIAAYVIGFHAERGSYALTESDGVFLYGRVSTFAECTRFTPPPSLAVLCDPRPPGRRGVAAEYVWDTSGPLYKLGPQPFAAATNGLAQQFAERAILAQPLDYLRAVGRDMLRSFGWTRQLSYDRKSNRLYVFSDPPPRIRSTEWQQIRAYQPGMRQPRAVQPYARFLIAYQRVIYLRGALLGVILLVGLAGLMARWRRRGGLVLLPWSVAVTLLLLPPLTAGFTYRYLLSVVPFACVAAGLGLARQGTGNGAGAEPGAAARPAAGSG